ncbi:unnamed protein product [Durusdinium trenchii]|uniref:Uncharacterized protein n=1 Tax=Durusdinium trenchii TaxID=1381693 RepID=A0ABP0MFR0_9DINO
MPVWTDIKIPAFEQREGFLPAPAASVYGEVLSAKAYFQPPRRPPLLQRALFPADAVDPGPPSDSDEELLSSLSQDFLHAVEKQELQRAEKCFEALNGGSEHLQRIISLADTDGNTALHRCVTAEQTGAQPRLAQLLVDANSPVDTSNVLGETPLLAAVRAQATADVVEVLLQARADPNHQDALSETALMEDSGRACEPWLVTYKEKWKDLIEMEWQEELRVVEDRLQHWPLAKLVGQGFCITDLEARKRGNFFGKAKIVFSKLDMPRHQFSSGDEVIVSLGNPLDKKAWKGEIIELGMSRIAIVADSPPWTLSGRWRLDCGANKTAYERTKSSLGYVTGSKYKVPDMRRLVLNEEGEQFLQPLPGGDSEPSHQAELNASQQAAIQAVEAFNLGLIQGPPGTGKTTTTCQMISGMVERRKKEGLRSCGVLVAADSNVAVDQLLSGLIRLGVKALRIGFPSKVSQELRQHTLLAQAEEHPLNAKIEETRAALAQVKDALYSGQLKGKGKGLAHRDISLHVRDIQKFEQQVSDELIDAAEVVCSTLIGCGCDALLQSSFDTVIIDEASQATEPRCLVAFQKAKKQFIMVGDQKQLPPVVLCQAAAEKGLQYSLFDRLLNSPTLFNEEINMLQVQYRMHPLIRKWPSMQFYGNKPQDGLCSQSFASSLMSQPFLSQSYRRKTPILFLDTSSTSADFLAAFGGNVSFENFESQNNEGSKYNLLEVELVKVVLKKLMQEMNPPEIVAGLRVLAGQHQSGALVPARVAVPLLAALLPMRQGTLRSFVEKA